jgi:hypothetical protein
MKIEDELWYIEAARYNQADMTPAERYKAIQELWSWAPESVKQIVDETFEKLFLDCEEDS